MVPSARVTTIEDCAERSPMKQVGTLRQLRRIALSRWVLKLDINHVPLVAVSKDSGAVHFFSSRRLDNHAVFERSFYLVPDRLHPVLRNRRIASGGYLSNRTTGNKE